MKSLKKAFLVSLILHLTLIFALELKWPKKAQPELVRIKLVSVKVEDRKKPIKKTKPKRPKKKKEVVKAKKTPKKTAKRPRRKEASKEGGKSAKTVKSKEPVLKEEVLKERLAALKEEVEIKKRLEALKERVGKRGSLRENYAIILRDHLERFYEIPLFLKGRKLEAEVRIRIGADGRLEEFEFKKRSGNPIFDAAVEKTVREASPYPAPGTPTRVTVIFSPEGLEF